MVATFHAGARSTLRCEAGNIHCHPHSISVSGYLRSKASLPNAEEVRHVPRILTGMGSPAWDEWLLTVTFYRDSTHGYATL